VPARDCYFFPAFLRLISSLGIYQSAGGTYLDTGAAETAVRVLQRPVEGGADHSIKAPLGEADSPYTSYIRAHLYTASAEDTEIIVAPYKRLAVIVHG
jgi:hypothetical protein